MIKKKATSLYIHIPFCKNICPYCDFLKFKKNNQIEVKYIDNVILDLNKLFNDGYLFDTIYIGGGTPTCLEYEHLERLLKAIKPLINFKINYEFTIEINPENINKTLLNLLKNNFINRVSIGIQSFNEDILNTIRRNYNIDIFQTINLVKSFFNNISIDLIYGFQNQTIEHLKNDLTKFLKLDIPHISIYSLTIHKGTKFYKMGVKEQDDEQSREFYDLIVKTFRDNGYKRYEVSNFARAGYQSRHNMNYWKNNEYVGIGLGASGFENNVVYKYIGPLKDFNDGKRTKDEEHLDENALYQNYLIANLRLEDGFLRKDFIKIFNKDIYKYRKDIIDKLINDGLLVLTSDRLKCTDEGLALLDFVLIKLI